MADTNDSTGTVGLVASLLRISMEDSGNLGDTENSRTQVSVAAAPPQVDEGSKRIFMTCSGRDVDDHIEKLLECPVCYDVILPPILSCVSGHSCCEGCRQSLLLCPICRGKFTNVRNLFAEQFLEKCLVKCKNAAAGCSIVLPAKELATHYHEKCDFRAIHCRECDVLVPFEVYLDHLRTKDKIDRQKASECSTGFEIDDQDFNSLNGERQAVWEPTWMYCYGQNFFCSLENNGEYWWIWISSLSEAGCQFKGQVVLWNKHKGKEVSYTGPIHCIRSKPDKVLETGECLIMKDKVLKDFMYQGGIDVLVRIERIYNPPKTRRGLEVESPLAVADRTKNKNPQQPPAPVAQLPSFVTPSRTLRSSARETGIATRIPTAASLLEVRSASGISRRHVGLNSSIPSSSGDEDRTGSTRLRGPTRRLLFDSASTSTVASPLTRTRNSRLAPRPQAIAEVNLDVGE